MHRSSSIVSTEGYLVPGVSSIEEFVPESDVEPVNPIPYGPYTVVTVRDLPHLEDADLGDVSPREDIASPKHTCYEEAIISCDFPLLMGEMTLEASMRAATEVVEKVPDEALWHLFANRDGIGYEDVAELGELILAKEYRDHDGQIVLTETIRTFKGANIAKGEFWCGIVAPGYAFDDGRSPYHGREREKDITLRSLLLKFYSHRRHVA
jgi:hypothetical protein